MRRCLLSMRGIWQSVKECHGIFAVAQITIMICCSANARRKSETASTPAILPSYAGQLVARTLPIPSTDSGKAPGQLGLQEVPT